MAGLKLPTEMAALRPKLAEIVRQGQSKAPYFSAFLSARSGLRIGVDNNEQRIVELPTTAGTVLTAFDGDTIYENALSGYDESRVRGSADDLLATPKIKHDFKPKEKTEHRGDFLTPMEIDPLELSIQEKLDRCRALQAQAKDADKRIVNARVSYVEGTEYSVFADQYSDLAQRVQRIYATLVVFVAGPDGQIRYDWASSSGTGGWELFLFSDEDVQRVVKGATDLISAERIEPGEYQIISGPGVSGTIAHESFGHGVEMDMFVKERAKAAHYIDKRVGSELVNITDDPSLPGSFGSYFFDDEGQMAGPTQIVENGIFRRGISDRYSAHALGISRSANGRRQDFSRKAYARMSNTFFNPGTSTLDEMLAQAGDGIFLDRWYSGMEDPQGWGIQVSCHYGHEIKNGKITGRVFAPIAISGYVPDVLESVSAVSNVLFLDAGQCGKGSKEILSVASGGPHLLLRAQLG